MNHLKRGMSLFCTGFVLGLVVAVSGIALAQTLSWTKNEVVPVVFVKSDMGFFVPIDGSSLDASWVKSQVVPMCDVEFDGTWFKAKGQSFASALNSWGKSQVRPFIRVKEQGGRFVAVEER